MRNLFQSTKFMSLTPRAAAVSRLASSSTHAQHYDPRPRAFAPFKAQQARNEFPRRAATSEGIPAAQSSPVTPATAQLGWLWRAGKDGSASTTVADLRQDHIRPKKSLGQNFVTDDGVLEDIVRVSGVKPGDLVLEVGPGTGNLTRHLLAVGATVTAIEKDDVLYSRLVKDFAHAGKLQVINGDVLKANLPNILKAMVSQARSAEASTSQVTASTSASAAETGSSAADTASLPALVRRIKVVANLPYNITKEFLKIMLPMGSQVAELNIMIQEEVARRLVTRTPGGSDYRAMNLRVLFYSRPKYRFIIPKGKYFPSPAVHGALVSFQLLPPELRLKVNKAFSERRKMMRNSLQPLYSYAQAEKGLEAAGLRTTARAQDLTIEQFVRFHNELHRVVLEEAGGQQLPGGVAVAHEVADQAGGLTSIRRSTTGIPKVDATALRDGQLELDDGDKL